MHTKFKGTEVGKIPEDWEVVTVQDLISREIIEMPIDGNHGSIHPREKDYVVTGIPFVMATDLRNGHVDIENCKYIRREQAESLQKGFAKEGDVLITHKGIIGRTAIIDNIQTDYIMLTPQVTYYRIRNHDMLSNHYLKYYFDYDMFNRLLKSWAGSGSTRDYLGI